MWKRAAGFVLLLSGCSEAESERRPPRTPSPPCAPGETAHEGGCCAAGSWPTADGACEPAGVPASACGEGFSSDQSGGCAPLLPAEDCPAGSMAVPGEMACAELAPCGATTWAGIPAEADNEYVDASYAGADSDGSEARPWSTIQQAVDAAAPGAIVAIAAGSYLETVYALNKPVRLWGRCPALVEIVPPSTEFGALFIEGSTGSEVRALSLTGGMPDGGVLVSGATAVVLDRVWIHDMPGRSLNVQATLGETSVTVRRSLIEHGDTHGMFLAGGDVTIEQTVVRDTLAGEGVVVRTYMGMPSKVSLLGSLIERSRVTGLRVSSSEVLVERSVIRDTLPLAGAGAPGEGANGIVAFEEGALAAPPPTSVAIRATVLSGHVGSAVFAGGAQLALEHVTVRDTRPLEGDVGAAAILASPFASPGVLGSQTSLEVRGSLVADSHGVGLWAGHDAHVERLLVRGTHAEVGTSVGAIGLAAGFTLPAALTLRGTVVEASEGGGVALDGVSGTVEGLLVRATHPGPTGRGEGLLIQRGWMSLAPSDVSVSGTRVEGSRRAGVVVLSSHASFEATHIGETAPSVESGRYGDGLTVQTRSEVLAAVELRGCLLDRSARAGLSSFGAAVAITDTTFDCNGLDLNGEDSLVEPPVAASFVDGGGNACGCGAERVGCAVQTSGLEAPEPPEPPAVE